MKLTRREVIAFEEAKEKLIYDAKYNDRHRKYWNGICEVVKGVHCDRIKEILYHYKPKKEWENGIYIWTLTREGYQNRLKLIDKILKDNS